MRLVSVLAFLAVAVVVAGCAGGTSSQVAESASHEERTAAAEEEAQRKDRSQKREELAVVVREQEWHQREKKRQKKEEERKKAKADAAVATVTAEEFHYFKDTDLGNWEIAYGICAVTPEKQLAREFHTEQNFAAIGHAYGSGYREPFNIAAEEGCMAALVDSEAEREAAFRLMEENE
jgi:hypothetical protein